MLSFALTMPKCSPPGGAWSPAQMPGVVFILEASYGTYQETTGASATTPAAVDGDPVGTWKAKTGQYFVALSNTQRPLLRIVSGVKMLQFDGVDDFLHLAAAPFAGGATASASVFARYNYISIPAGGRAAVFGQSNDQIALYDDDAAAQFVGQSRDSGGNYCAATLAATPAGSWHSGGTVMDGVGSLVHVYRDSNTASSATTSGGLLVSTNGLQVGAASGGALGWFNGYLASVVGCNGASQQADITKLFDYFAGLAS